MEDALHRHPDPGGDLRRNSCAFTIQSKLAGCLSVAGGCSHHSLLHSFPYMYASVIKLAYRADRTQDQGILVPGGKVGVWIAGLLGFSVTLLSIIFAMIPPETESKWLFETKLLGATMVTIAIDR